jgi:hypothetical protein
LNKKAETNTILLGVVGVIAVIALIVGLSGSKGATGNVVLDQTTVVQGGPIAALQAQVGKIAADVGSLQEQKQMPDWIVTFPTTVGDASAYNKDGYLTDGVIYGGAAWGSDFAITARRTSLTTVSLIVTSSPHIHVSLSDSAIPGPGFSQLDIVAGTTDGHSIYIHGLDTVTGTTFVQRLRYVSSVHNQVVGIWNDGIIGGTGVAGDVVNPAVGVSS